MGKHFVELLETTKKRTEKQETTEIEEKNKNYKGGNDIGRNKKTNKEIKKEETVRKDRIPNEAWLKSPNNVIRRMVLNLSRHSLKKVGQETLPAACITIYI
ncbi:hypothetical protein Zmor_023275 [Zophobas morio]|uniref:Uncharacterized protein n=1 Tax=Zophobas morio TaxID=2755281 RepID=A0AA38HYF9_9CUCU|nr:hypothetical protein Zmor_023275 [Zophobas morio]